MATWLAHELYPPKSLMYTFQIVCATLKDSHLLKTYGKMAAAAHDDSMSGNTSGCHHESRLDT